MAAPRNVKQVFNWSLQNLFALCCSSLRSQFFGQIRKFCQFLHWAAKVGTGEGEMVATKCTLLIASALPARKVEIKLNYLITYLSFDDGINILCNSRIIDQWRKKIFLQNLAWHLAGLHCWSSSRRLVFRSGLLYFTTLLTPAPLIRCANSHEFSEIKYNFYILTHKG